MWIQLHAVLGPARFASATEACDTIRKRRDELLAIPSQRINHNEAIATTIRRARLATEEIKGLNLRRGELQSLGRKLQDQAMRNAAVRKWRQIHLVQAWLHDIGILTLPVATIPGSQDELRRAWEQAKQEDEQVRLRFEAMQRELREASRLRDQLQGKIRQEANSEMQALSARLDLADALLADLEHIEETEQQARNQATVLTARNPDVDRDDESHQWRTP